MRRWIVLCLLLALPGALAWTQPAYALVNEVAAANRYTANGSTTAFAYTFKVYLNTDLEVLVGTTVKTLGTDYTVDGLGVSGGGNVTFVAAPAADAIVTILRKQPAAQASDYVPNEAFPSARIEKDLDKLVMQVQQLKEEADRAMKLPKSSALVDQTVDVPTVGSFARGKVGGGIDWATVTSAGEISVPVSIAEGGTGATTKLAARNNLEVGQHILTAVNASGTAIEYTGIPAGTKRITVMVVGLSTNGTSNVQVQVGDASNGFATATYVTSYAKFANAGAVAAGAVTTGWIVHTAGSATAAVTGKLVIDLLIDGATTWVGSGSFARTDNGDFNISAGYKTIGAVIDRIRITTVNGTDTFDVGVVNVSYE